MVESKGISNQKESEIDEEKEIEKKKKIQVMFD